MGKKSNKSMKTKTSKQEKKQEAALHSLIRDLRPKVYITDSSNFMKLVQELTGNDPCCSSPAVSSPQTDTSTYVAATQTWQVPMMLEVTEEERVMFQSDIEFLSDGSPCFSVSSSMEGSSDLYVPPQPVLNYGFEDPLKNMDFESDQFCDLDSLFTGLTEPCDHGYDLCYGMSIENEVSVFDYDFDLSALM